MSVEGHRGSENAPMGTNSPTGAVSAQSYSRDAGCKIKRQQWLSVGFQRRVCPGHHAQGK